jgi:DNA-binding NarL/FixJ family response regulator
MVEDRMGRPIRVIMVDDHPIMREGTLAYLQRAPEIEVVGVTGEGSEAIYLVSRERPDVLLLDLHLPDMSGVEVARRIRDEFPGVAVLILTGHDEVGYVRALLQLGIRGYLRKTVAGTEIVAAVRAVAEGKQVLISESLRAVAGDGHDPLTDREHQVLQLLAAGRRNAEIATGLRISLKTVEYHISHVLDKLGAQSRSEAIRTARRQGLIL